jgi:hypothetical protein
VCTTVKRGKDFFKKTCNINHTFPFENKTGLFVIGSYKKNSIGEKNSFVIASLMIQDFLLRRSLKGE